MGRDGGDIENITHANELATKRWQARQKEKPGFCGGWFKGQPQTKAHLMNGKPEEPESMRVDPAFSGLKTYVGFRVTLQQEPKQGKSSMGHWEQKGNWANFEEQQSGQRPWTWTFQKESVVWVSTNATAGPGRPGPAIWTRELVFNVAQVGPSSYPSKLPTTLKKRIAKV